MEDDLIEKIENIVSKKEEINEEDVRSLMTLIRKLLDPPYINKSPYSIIRLFADWTVHNEITRSNTGLGVLAEINDTIVDIKGSIDAVEIQTKITQSIGFPVLRKQLKDFFDEKGIENILTSDNEVWAVYISYLIEIIRDVPISFPSLQKMDKGKREIYDKIVKNPIKLGAGVISISIRLIDWPVTTDSHMCLIIKTEDTTSLIVPLLIDARV